MKCPACQNAMTLETIDGIEVDICDGGCGGIWFDQHEFKKFDEVHENPLEKNLSIRVNSDLKIDHEKRRHCPRCLSVVMMRRFSSPKRHAHVDECGQCAGVWLDAGELSAIRDEFPTEALRSRAAEEFCDDMFGKDMQSARKESLERQKRYQRFSLFVRVLWPLYLRLSQDKTRPS